MRRPALRNHQEDGKKIKMYSELNDLIREYAFDTIDSEILWYHTAFDQAQALFMDLDENDWKQLFDELPAQTHAWKVRFASLLCDDRDFHQLKAAFYLSIDSIGDLDHILEEFLYFCDPYLSIHVDELHQELKTHESDLYAFDLERFLTEKKRLSRRPG